MSEKLLHTRIEKAPREGQKVTAGVSTLPTEITSRTAIRLRAAAVIYAVTYALAVGIGSGGDFFVRGEPYQLHTAHLFAAVFIVLAAIAFVVARAPWLSSNGLINLGLAFEVVSCLGIGVGELSGGYRTGMVPAGISWICVWLVTYPLIVPSPIRKAAVAAILSAAMAPLAVYLMISIGGSLVPPPEFIFGYSFPPFICAGIAVFGSSVIYGMGKDLQEARRMGSYRLDRMLGRGGMGEVWRAQHRMLARPAAIKLIQPEMLGGGDGGDVVLKRFEREAQATGKLSSPHTIRLFDFGITEEGVFYYVMELLDGMNLEAMVSRHGPLPPERAVHFLGQTCDSLAEAHAQGMVHRDIKPANIYACRAGLEYDFAKVLDFGLVKPPESGSAHDAKLTADSVTTGTPAYMPPEVALGRDVDPRADLYALGCVAYWLVTGELVFQGDSPVEVVIQHAQNQPVPPSRRTEYEIPESLDEIILWCLEKEPGQRPPSATELRTRLEQLDFAGAWTQERAAHWWEQHRPAAATE
jgi:serine/threonine-protein kinase